MFTVSNQKLIINHNSGFFSCCNVKLDCIIYYFNIVKKLPEIVDSSRQFRWYKSPEIVDSSYRFRWYKLNTNTNTNTDITYDYFNHYINYNNIDYKQNINYRHGYQFIDYSSLDYKNITPFIIKYFSPSSKIKTIISDLETKYTINYNNICVLFYRGNDKNTETRICGYDEYIKYANAILQKNPNITFLLQSDETEFIEKMLSIFPINSIYFKDEIRHMKKQNSTVDITMKTNIDIFSKNYLAITIMMSKCKFIICGSGNCSLWIMLYRGNNDNTYQNLNGNWIYTIEE